MTLRVLYLVCFALVAGCGSRTANVAGTVTYKGEKLPTGTVSFVCAGKLAEGEIHDGRYEIHGLPAGEARVAVVRLDSKQPHPYAGLNSARKQTIDRQPAKDIDPRILAEAAKVRELEKKQHLLPYAYSSPDTSKLRFTVSPGNNRFDIVLHDDADSR